MAVGDKSREIGNARSRWCQAPPHADDWRRPRSGPPPRRRRDAPREPAHSTISRMPPPSSATTGLCLAAADHCEPKPFLARAIDDSAAGRGSCSRRKSPPMVLRSAARRGPVHAADSPYIMRPIIGGLGTRLGPKSDPRRCMIRKLKCEGHAFCTAVDEIARREPNH
jgi:hypothetical protein